jgi:rhodanese-related sulfurtransferase
VSTIIPQIGSFAIAMRVSGRGNSPRLITSRDRERPAELIISGGHPRGMVEEIEPVELAELLKGPEPAVVLLDVRESDERETARIEPSLHIPMDQVPDRLAEIPADRKIVVYCHHGTRSAMVAGFLEGEGFPRVANLTGGIDEWSHRVDRSVPRY